MGKSLFAIEDKYLQLMQQIEENDGELTPELEQELTINLEECEAKLKAYHHIIQNNKSEIQLIKDEKERLSKLASIKENLIERLKSSVLDATILYGNTGKSGNKKIDYDTLKLYTVNKDSIDVQENYFLNNANLALQSNQEYLDNMKAFQYQVSVKLSLLESRDLLKLINDSKNETLIKLFNSNYFTPIISKTLIKEVIDEGIEVPFCEKVNNPYIMMK